ncbi:hypothetical protein [Yoonia litorea]|uniref:Uncharacterized protein n=1 Tax=Yoonia litorea TaxID=1123755 RepID=A0A1I6LW26_9RHOB|nr:hypothetical protein [Yoonia litorea]SFS07598.1 hypothetical protein SAMN05444714_0947 [Yoonia litorea]
MTRVLIAVLMLAVPAQADGWRVMSGAEITRALTDRTLIYSAATQRFYASGRTLYDAGRESWGYWAVRGDQYCSQWPPSDGWDFYDMATDGTQLRFIASDGSTTDGAFAE